LIKNGNQSIKNEKQSIDYGYQSIKSENQSIDCGYQSIKSEKESIKNEKDLKDWEKY